MVRYMSDLARSKISMISEISIVQKNIGSPKTRKFRWKYRDIMDILDHGRIAMRERWCMICAAYVGIYRQGRHDINNFGEGFGSLNHKGKGHNDLSLSRNKVAW